jgi:biopolymer transport protein ExbD
MISRPLDLASRLRPAPRNFDAWFYVNAGLLVFFFYWFGSRFVLAPGLGVDFKLPRIAGASLSTAPTHHISVLESGQIYGDQGLLDLPQLRAWLQGEKKGASAPSLLVVASSEVKLTEIADITSVAYEAGFHVILASVQPDGPAGAAY